MVAFPDSGPETTSHNQENVLPEINHYLPDELGNVVAFRSEALGTPENFIHSSVNNSKFSKLYETPKAMEGSKLELSPENLTTEHAIMKKVAAALKNSDAFNSKDGQSTVSSLSSSLTIVTIDSVGSDSGPEFPNDEKKPYQTKLVTDETWYHTTLQIALPFFLAGIGTIGAGLILDKVRLWTVFQEITQLFILVPSLLGLKGNLDMCLASRLSTQANLGNMNSCREVVKMIVGNVALVQVQAIVAATLVAFFAIIVSIAMTGSCAFDYSLLMIAASISTATSSCFILDFVMVAIVILSHRCKMNPDNLATPLAASVGDVVSLGVLSVIASFLFTRLNQIWILYLVICCYLVLLPVWICIVLKNKYTKNILATGWIPVLSALFISGIGGIILDQVVDRFNGFVIFQPIINGIGGNLVAVQASRISTMLHQTSIMGILPPHAKICISPIKALFKGAITAKSARILIAMAIPGHLAFTTAADFISQGRLTVGPEFVLSYLSVALLQITLLLYVAHIMIHALWKMKIDPDNSAIPCLTALGDVTGSLFLAVAFLGLELSGLEYGTT